jgi:CSLREA domain-containing protein
MRKLPVFFECVLLVCLVLSSPLAAYAMPNAPTYTVNSTADIAGIAGDAVCETAPGGGICTLRAAIMAANHVPGGGATILLPTGTYDLTIARVGADDETSGDLNVTQDMSIQGAGASSTIIDASGLVPGDRVLHVVGAALTLSGVTVRNGALVDNNGAGIRLDDNLSSIPASLTLEDSIVSDNSISLLNDVFGGLGAGIYGGSGAIVIDRSSVSNNLITIFPTAKLGVFGGGAGIFQESAILTVRQSEVNFNIINSPVIPAENVGSAIGTYGNTDVSNSTINGNVDDHGLGAIFNSGGTMTILNSTIRYNTSGVLAGGIINNNGTLVITNSTITGNTSGGNGGGLSNCPASVCIVSLYNVTISSNTAGVASSGGGIFNGAGGIVHFQNTIISGNRTHSFSGIPPFLPNDCSGTIISAGYNLVQTASSCTISGLTSGNQVGVSPDLGNLQDNGGSTYTQALLPASPAISAGNPSGCTNNLRAILTTDQRGFPREVYRAEHMRCDIGAYQTQLMTFLPIILK